MAKIETLVRRLLREHGVISPPIPVEQIAQNLGAEVCYMPFEGEGEVSGMLYRDLDQKVIGVNSLHNPNRQRFTIAHEIGHLLLHRDLISESVHVDKQFRVLMRDSHSATGLETIEVQANQFASELLIPSSLFDPTKIAPSDIDDDAQRDDLAKKFRVSRQMLEYRISNSSS